VPIFSAVKVNGKKLYEYARNNENVKLPKKDITIHSLELLDINEDEITIKTKVSKGTYIRSLVRDIAERLGTFGTLTALERTYLGSFSLEEASSFDDILNNDYKIYSIAQLLKDYPKEEIDPQMLFKVRNGQIIDKEIEDYILFTSNGKEIALYEKYKKEAGKIKPSVMFYILENK
jgi:tRNA pseudouridine55 synthase